MCCGWLSTYRPCQSGPLHSVSTLLSSGLAERKALQPVSALRSSGKLSHLYSGKGDFQVYVFGNQKINVSLEGEGKVLLHLQHVLKL